VATNRECLETRHLVEQDRRIGHLAHHNIDDAADLFLAISAADFL
jgi:hypothetical protein